MSEPVAQHHSDAIAVCVYRDLNAADRGLQCLEKSGFKPSDVSILRHGDQGQLDQIAEKSPAAGVAQTDDVKRNSGSAAGGAALGGGVAAALSMATLIGPFMIAGPLLGVLGGAAAGAGISALADYGFEEDMPRRVSESLEQGGIAVAVHGDVTAVQQAVRILQTTAPKDLYFIDQ